MCELLDKNKNKGMARISELVRRLIGDGVSDEIDRAVTDQEFQNKLLAEYGL